MKPAIWTTAPGTFAAAELKKYLVLATGTDWPLAACRRDAIIQLELVPEDSGRDGFTVVSDGACFSITGSNSRSLLYGAYALLERELDIRFFAPGREIIPSGKTLKVSSPYTFGTTADFMLRQIRLEWLPGETMVDWAAKNCFNSISMDFWLWDSPAGQEVRQAAERRGLELGGSGHGMFHFLPAERYFAAHPEWFPEVGGQRRPTKNTGDNFCYSNVVARKEIIKNIVSFQEQHDYLKRLNLWPGDGGLICECAACRTSSMTELYAGLVTDICRNFADKQVNVHISQLAYNYNLRDKKLDALKVSCHEPEVPTMFAFWGQNLTIPLAENSDSGHRAAWFNIGTFCGRAPDKAAIFSYHTDTYMNSNLCPVFFKAMAADFRNFKRLGIDEACLLWIPWDERDTKMTEWIAHQNGALWGRLAMDAQLSEIEYRRDYYRMAYGQELASRVEALWNEVNDCLGKLSALIFPFAPPRVSDAWGCGFNRQVMKWDPSDDRNELEQMRFETVKEMAGDLSKLYGAASRVHDTGHGEWKMFSEYIDHCAVRAAGLSCLFGAQMAIRRGDWKKAVTYLGEALETGMVDEREQTRTWLNIVKDKHPQAI